MQYIRATTVADASAAIADGATPLAGGTVLVRGLATIGASVRTLVDIGRIADLSDMFVDGDHLQIGSLVTLARLADDPLVKTTCAALAEAAAAAGNPQVRRAATLGGNVALGLPTADAMPALVALDAQVTYRSPAGQQTSPVADYRAGGTLITAIRVPLQGLRSAFRKYATRHASGITLVSAAVAVDVRDGRVAFSRIVAGGLSRRPARQPKAEALLAGQICTDTIAARVADTAARDALCDVEGPPSEAFRRRLLSVGVRELLTGVSRP
jgi:CO/xanthine dehydrogenase FAD-binding subunit